MTEEVPLPATSEPQLGVFLSHANDVIGPNLEYLVAAGQILDAHVDYVVVADHVVLARDPSGHEVLGGGLPYPVDEPYPDPLVTLAALAATTQRLRLATGVLVVPLRPAVLLAKMVATLAVVSHGRLDLGVGSGWQVEEFAALGVPVDGKTRRMDDALQACRELWRGGVRSFSSETVTFDDVCCSPAPTGDVPLWFAGSLIAPTVSRIARMGAGWLPLRTPAPDDLRAARSTLGDACEEASRPRGAVGIRVSGQVVRTDGGVDFGATAAGIGELWAAGATGVHLPLRQLSPSIDDLGHALSELKVATAAVRASQSNSAVGA